MVKLTDTIVDEKTTSNAPLIVIVGPTASGKSSVAMRIAEDFNGEIICADSRTIYKGTDIGTAKPSAEDRQKVPHWGLDIVEPGQPYSAADFKEYALQKISEIRSRGAVPLLVGGTGLYVDGVIFDYNFVEPNLELRRQLESLTLVDLQEYCKSNNIQLPENTENKRYLIRAIERDGVEGTVRKEPIENTIIVGITTDPDELRQRIVERTAEFFSQGVIEEARVLGEKYGWGSNAMTGNAYPLVRQYLEGELSREELVDKFITADWRLAKRQRTYLRRNSFIHWLPLSKAYEHIAQKLNKI